MFPYILASASKFVLSLFSFATGNNINCPLLISNTTLTSSNSPPPSSSTFQSPVAPSPSLAAWVVPVAASVSSLFAVGLVCIGLAVFLKKRQNANSTPRNAYLINNSPPPPHQPHLFSFFSKRSHSSSEKGAHKSSEGIPYNTLAHEGIPFNSSQFHSITASASSTSTTTANNVHLG